MATGNYEGLLAAMNAHAALHYARYPLQHQLLRETGLLDEFRAADGRRDGVAQDEILTEARRRVPHTYAFRDDMTENSSLEAQPDTDDPVPHAAGVDEHGMDMLLQAATFVESAPSQERLEHRSGTDEHGMEMLLQAATFVESASSQERLEHTSGTDEDGVEMLLQAATFLESGTDEHGLNMLLQAATLIESASSKEILERTTGNENLVAPEASQIHMRRVRPVSNPQIPAQARLCVSASQHIPQANDFLPIGPREMSSSKPVPLKIAILDDYLSIATPLFAHISQATVENYPTTLNPSKSLDLEALVTRLQPYTIISTMRERTTFPSNLLVRLPNLRLLLTTGLRNASLDLEAAKSLGITIAGTTGSGPTTHIPGLESSSFITEPMPAGYDNTSQHTWALILALANNVPRDAAALNAGNWQTAFTTSLAGKTLGLVGLGKLGSHVAKIGSAFGMKIIAWSSSLTQEKADEKAEACGLGKGVFRAVSKEELFATADVVSVHLVLGDRSRGVVGEKELREMKKSAFFVNTARAGLVDEGALYRVMLEGGIRGVGLDVWWEEPVGAESLWRREKWGEGGRSVLVGTPHVGYVEEGMMKRWYAEQAENVERWIRGEEVKNKLV
ncbi:hypothetical protein MMC13_002530 [Lambiella insularis]|nr:hypothetical protein [Lambiella insularis]